MTKIRVGIVGVGTIAQAAHIPFYARHDEVEIVGFADPEVSRVKQFAEDFATKTGRPIPPVYASQAELIQNEKPDAVSICTPNNSHIPLAMEAVQSGLHVLVEKPMGVTNAEADELVRCVAGSTKTLMVGMSHRYREDVAVLKRYVESGDLGDIYYAKTRILRRRGTPRGWFSDQKLAGGGPLMDIGVHALDLAWWLMGMPQPMTVSGFLHRGIGRDELDFVSTWEASSQGNRNNEVFTTEDFASAFLRFTNGSAMQMEVSWALNGAEDDALKVDIYGTKGGISLDPLRYFSTAHRVLTATTPSVGMGSLSQREIDHFLHCIRTGEAPCSNAQQGRDVIRMLSGIAESSLQQRELRIVQEG